jgi:hypothetical protein
MQSDSPRPAFSSGLKVATDRNFDGKLRDIEPLFKEYLNAFIPLVLSPSNILVKKISGSEVKCRDLLRYFRAYVDIFQVPVSRFFKIFSPKKLAKKLAINLATSLAFFTRTEAKLF